MEQLLFVLEVILNITWHDLPLLEMNKVSEAKRVHTVLRLMLKTPGNDCQWPNATLDQSTFGRVAAG